ncbi:SCO family protein [Natronosalvus amylolyticus]|uniref:SCO family protein n=1 Tax=Natronosalvus amylolyticus TaxID=2961994 RepID=UPI0020CA1B89|nr:SCO family protein [Natronosalvus amylolyticus]
MDRRTYLGGLAGTGIAGLAGCLGTIESQLSGEQPGSGDWGDGETVLDTPTEDRGTPNHPIYGHEMPSFSFPDPLTGETVSSSDLEGRTYLMTFFFTHCPDGACPALLLRLRRAQADAIENGYDNDLALLAMTFDPERDTPEVLETYAGQQGVDLEAGNWHFLRPENYESGAQVLREDFGMLLDRIEDEEELAELEEEHGHGDDSDGDEDEHSDEHDDGHSDGHDDGHHGHGEYTFVHYNLIFLVNEHGVVERSYPNALRTDTETIVEDVRAVTRG